MTFHVKNMISINIRFKYTTRCFSGKSYNSNKMTNFNEDIKFEKN